MDATLSIVFRAISGFLVRKAKFTGRRALCGAVTLSQRLGSALNLNLRSHVRTLLKSPDLTVPL